MLSSDDQRRLLRLARSAFEARVRRLPAPAGQRGGALDTPAGAFVTIHCAGDLRGCLGQIEPTMLLGEVVAHLAAVVSDSDPRFAPVAAEELVRIRLEISVLTPETDVRALD